MRKLSSCTTGLAWGLITITAGLAGCDVDPPSTHRQSPTSASVLVPKAAQHALHQRFQGPLEKLHWQTTPTGLTASFRWRTIPMRSQVTRGGVIAETELEVEDLDVPPAVWDALQHQYPSYQVRQLRLVETGNKRFFRLHLTSPRGETRAYSFTRASGLVVDH